MNYTRLYAKKYLKSRDKPILGNSPQRPPPFFKSATFSILTYCKQVDAAPDRVSTLNYTYRVAQKSKPLWLFVIKSY